MNTHLAAPLSVVKSFNRWNANKQAGDWELSVPYPSPTYNFSQIKKIVKSVKTAFPWGDGYNIEIAFTNYSPHYNSLPDNDIDKWLQQLEEKADSFNGIEIEILNSIITDSYLNHTEPLDQGIKILCDLPHKDRTFDIQISVPVNLYTDRIWVKNIDTQEGEEVDIAAFARHNRQLLRESLQKFESEMGGVIKHWYSELGISGIERYGYSENAKEL